MLLKLDKKLLEAHWEEGGRKPSKWCDYYLDYNVGRPSVLLETANAWAYLTWVLTLPIMIPLLIIGFMSMCVVKLFEWCLDKGWCDQRTNPVICVNSTLFNKGAIRSDEIPLDKEDQLDQLVNCLKSPTKTTIESGEMK